MKVQLRRFVTIGLMSGSLALSALIGGAAVGAAAPNSAPDPTGVNNGVSKSTNHELRDDGTIVVVTADRTVTITPASTSPSADSIQVSNRDSR